MSNKSLLFVYGGRVQEIDALESALAVARAGRATLRILHISERPVLPGLLGINEYAVTPVGDGTVVDLLEQHGRELTAEARSHADVACQHQQVPVRAGLADMVPGQAQAIYRTAVGPVGDCLAPEAFTADLVLSAYDNHPAADIEVVLAALFHVGKPILLFPRDASVVFPSSGHAQNVVLAWDGSRAAARALREAVPHMLHSRKVNIVRIMAEGESPDVVSEDEVLIYLRSHCISASFVHVQRQKLRIGEAILETAKTLNADLLIMGAYGHGHVREMLLGGVTDHVVKNADLPLLLVH